MGVPPLRSSRQQAQIQRQRPNLNLQHLDRQRVEDTLLKKTLLGVLGSRRGSFIAFAGSEQLPCGVFGHLGSWTSAPSGHGCPLWEPLFFQGLEDTTEVLEPGQLGLPVADLGPTQEGAFESLFRCFFNFVWVSGLEARAPHHKTCQ